MWWRVLFPHPWLYFAINSLFHMFFPGIMNFLVGTVLFNSMSCFSIECNNRWWWQWQLELMGYFLEMLNIHPVELGQKLGYFNIKLGISVSFSCFLLCVQFWCMFPYNTSLVSSALSSPCLAWVFPINYYFSYCLNYRKNHNCRGSYSLFMAGES